MKKLKLKALALGAKEVLTRVQMKNVLGGSGSDSGSGSGGGAGLGPCQGECWFNSDCPNIMRGCTHMMCYGSNGNFTVGYCM